MHWYKTSYGMERLALEQDLLSMDYPSMSFMHCDDDYIRVCGQLGAANLCQNSYYIVTQYPANYPHGRIRIWAPEERFPFGTPHIYGNGELCVEHNDFKPADTMSTALSWALQWLALYEEFRRTGKRW